MAALASATIAGTLNSDQGLGSSVNFSVKDALWLFCSKMGCACDPHLEFQKQPSQSVEGNAVVNSSPKVFLDEKQSIKK